MRACKNNKRLNFIISLTLFVGLLLIIIYVGILILNKQGEAIYIACCEQLGGKIDISAFDCDSIPSECAKCSIDDLSICSLNSNGG